MAGASSCPYWFLFVNSKGFEIVTLKSGVKSLRSLDRKETYHPGVGPSIEARVLHVEQQRLVERSAVTEHFSIWDVGFGAAANALTALAALRDSPAQLEVHSFDRTLAPAEFALAHAEELGYVLGYEAQLRDLLKNRRVQFGPRCVWHLHLGDFRDSMLDSTISPPHAILYDPYSPSGNSEMWTLEHFADLRARLLPNQTCLWTNYTRATGIRVSLLLAGFYVGVGALIGEKDQTTIASNDLAAIDRPLDRTWLERVRVSHTSAPLRRGAGYSIQPISDADFSRLSACAQFR